MIPELRPAEGLLGQMTMLRIETDGPVMHLRLNRPDKRNALNETLVRELQTAFVNLPKDARVAVISGEGAHFSAGLDLSEVTEQTVAEGIFHSRKWHAAFDGIGRREDEEVALAPLDGNIEPGHVGDDAAAAVAAMVDLVTRDFDEAGDHGAA